MTAEKMCSECRQVKPLSEYYPYKNSVDGLSYACKACESIRKKRIYANKNGKPQAHKIWMIGCDKCDYVKDCDILVKKRGEDPYCFVTNPNHGVWMREMGFAEA